MVRVADFRVARRRREAEYLQCLLPGHCGRSTIRGGIVRGVLTGVRTAPAGSVDPVEISLDQRYSFRVLGQALRSDLEKLLEGQVAQQTVAMLGGEDQAVEP